MPLWTDFFIVTAIVLAGLAPMTASFLQCWADRARAGRGMGVPQGRSTCDSCGTTLAARDLVPVLSWFWNRGRARCCGAALHPRFLYAEVLALVLAVWGILSVPWTHAPVTLLLAAGLQAVVLLTGPHPHAARGFAGVMVLLGLLTIGLVREPALIFHSGATLLAFAIWLIARMVRLPAADALFLLLPAGAFLGFKGMAIAAFVAIPAALLIRWIRPQLYPEAERRPVMPAEAVVFGLAVGLWLTWLYFLH